MPLTLHRWARFADELASETDTFIDYLKLDPGVKKAS
jgi:hypothetical protein